MTSGLSRDMVETPALLDLLGIPLARAPVRRGGPGRATCVRGDVWAR